MRSLKVLLTAAAGLVLLACNTGQPRIYKVAVDNKPLLDLPQTCFSNNEIPAGSVRYNQENLFDEHEWTIWDGVEGKQYLDMGGTAHWQLGDSAPIVIDDLIEGKDDTFVGTRTSTRLADSTGYTNSRTRTATVTFDDQGATAKGTLDLASSYTCTNCYDGETEQPGNKNCATKLTFVGRRVDTQRISVNE